LFLQISTGGLSGRYVAAKKKILCSVQLSEIRWHMIEERAAWRDSLFSSFVLHTEGWSP